MSKAKIFNPKIKKINFQLWKYRELTLELALRELRTRYRGSFLGFIWSLIVPILMLIIYTYIFSVVFQARWQLNGSPTTSTEYALIMFVGITVFNIFSEVVNRCTTLIPTIPNFVKKVAFPLEIYPVVILLSTLIITFVNIILIIISNLILSGIVSKTIFLLPLAYLPLIFLALGFGWFLASLGVFIRDLGQIIPVILTIIFFLSPIVYPLDMVPRTLQPIIYLNPLTSIVDGFRQVLLWGRALPWSDWAICTSSSFLLSILGYIWFVRTKKGFADVL